MQLSATRNRRRLDDRLRVPYAHATASSPEGVRDFLEPRHGRHFGDMSRAASPANFGRRGDRISAVQRVEGLEDQPPHEPRDRDGAHGLRISLASSSARPSRADLLLLTALFPALAALPHRERGSGS